MRLSGLGDTGFQRDAVNLLEGKKIEAESYHRNVTLLGSILVKLGMAMKSRDVTKRDRAGADDFGAALIEASIRSCHT